jgi:hypothetical protein
MVSFVLLLLDYCHLIVHEMFHLELSVDYTDLYISWTLFKP